MRAFPSDVAFTEAVKAVQTRKGSRKLYARVAKDGWETRVTPELRGFLAAQNSFFLASANTEGQPYLQHRGGPAGFLKVIDESTLGFADFSGNRQYISLGNLAENPKVQLFLIDYAHRRRIKIWGEAKVVTDDPKLLAALSDPEYPARVEQAMVIKISAWDLNCPQHIPQLFAAEDVAEALAVRDARIAKLEAELARNRLQPAPK